MREFTGRKAVPMLLGAGLAGTLLLSGCASSEVAEAGTEGAVSGSAATVRACTDMTTAIIDWAGGKSADEAFTTLQKQVPGDGESSEVKDTWILVASWGLEQAKYEKGEESSPTREDDYYKAIGAFYLACPEHTGALEEATGLNQ